MVPLPRPLRGIIPPMVTPLLSGDRLDKVAAVRQAERMIAAGVSGLFLLGTTGEAPGLSYRLREELVELICCQVRGRVPVLVSITDTAMAESMRTARHAAEHGASALVVAPPYYYATSQQELLGYMRRLIPELPLPVYLYNIPSHTQTPFAPETVRALAGLPNVFGVKDSSGDGANLRALVSILADRPDFAVLCGPEEMLAEAIQFGVHGGIAGGSNLSPRFYVELYRAAAAGDLEKVARMQAVVMEISTRIYHASPEGSAYLRGMKGALSCIGYCKNVLAEPYEPFGPDVMTEIETAVREIHTRFRFSGNHEPHEEFL
jgi:dihydrodipicolinate synthase/N-acetylneuraminate lyase